MPAAMRASSASRPAGGMNCSVKFSVTSEASPSEVSHTSSQRISTGTGEVSVATIARQRSTMSAELSIPITRQPAGAFCRIASVEAPSEQPRS